MKKVLIITLILFVSFTSMSFRGCDLYWRIVDVLNGGSGVNISGIIASLYVGNNGAIWRSSGETNIIFEQKISGTTQHLNRVRGSFNGESGSSGFVLVVGNNGTICRSTDTGNNWSVSPPVTSANLYGAEFNNIYSYAVGNNGTVLWSFDEGITWSQVPSGTSRNLKAISLSNQFGSNVVAVGEKGAIVRSTNSGQNWTNISLADTTINFYDISQQGIYYYDGNKFCIVGSGGRIYKSTDGGATWVQKPSGTTNTLRSIYFHTQDSAVVVGDNGTIRFSTNGGETWFTDSFFNSPSTRNFKAVSLVNLDDKTYWALSDTLWFVSNEPLILGLNNVNKAIPQIMSLHQNYPNPFNPVTNIKFQIVNNSFVILKIYDITGREIQTLVNEKQVPGTYEVNWDASGYSSGLYFYRISADNFTDVKKMILVK